MEYEVFNLVMLAISVFVAGFVDSLAGGGGLITIPAYLAFGLDPLLILGTNKMSSSMGTFLSALKFRDKIKIEKPILFKMLFLALIFSAVGAWFATLINPEKLKFLILIFIPLVAIFVIKNKNFGSISSWHLMCKVKRKKVAYLISSSVSCYDGFFGPGTGTMFAVFLTKYAKMDLVQATAVAKSLNFSSNIFSLLLFAYFARVDFYLGITVGLFSVLGNSFGVFIGKRKGQKIIRPMLILVSVLIILKLIFIF
ncbi:MAG: TSUP family transporter [Elusimicrobiaceae bacterium]|jgi:uncharacterized protein|nr:TSUP family transporter [Elusimicrobiaceae bacterium]MBT3955280.1 TSUP family transporter [Elusimicrobiaceae bacterium]MBT4008304.1 TSUP family transporter [Elusimicrobiaceae bacterium]MBT4403287.1 TSUP family transporter [Elusimicrobiaceae bacterium]MBT4440435.1 TSUP family transporter [Elusimicrobiaceae bacterium]